MRRVAMVAVALLVAVGAAPGASMGAGRTGAHAKPKVRCHWVKATKKRRRHRVCVRVKPRAKRPGAGSTAKAPAAPVAPVPAPVLPVAAPAPIAEPTPVAGADPDPAPVTSDPAPAPARLQATTREWSITLSRPSIAAGSVIVELVNRGEDGHDLHVRPASGGPDALAIAETAAGGVTSTSGTLPAGSYVLYCGLPGHEAAGMHATLIVG